LESGVGVGSWSRELESGVGVGSRSRTLFLRLRTPCVQLLCFERTPQYQLFCLSTLLSKGTQKLVQCTAEVLMDRGYIKANEALASVYFL